MPTTNSYTYTYQPIPYDYLTDITSSHWTAWSNSGVHESYSNTNGTEIPDLYRKIDELEHKLKDLENKMNAIIEASEAITALLAE